MTEQPVALHRYVEEAKIDELAAEWRRRGYKVAKHKRVEGREVDLVATRDGERILFEVKTAQRLRESQGAIRSLAAQASRWPRTQFRLVVANPPRRKYIDVQGLDRELAEHLREETYAELDGLSSHTIVEDVADVEVDEVRIAGDGIAASGTATLEVRLQYGPDSDDSVTSDSFPLEFDVVLGRDLKLKRVNRIEIDTSSFFDEPAGATDEVHTP